MGILRSLGRFRHGESVAGFRFGRPLVLLQSDDWGRVGVRDEEGREELVRSGLKIGERAYDLYSLETSEDVTELVEALAGSRDSAGQAACLEANFITANLDFTHLRGGAAREVKLKPLHSGLPGKWRRDGLCDAYGMGVKRGVIVPALHGAMHFCTHAVSEALQSDGPCGELLRTLWQAETPYIYWRMPWVGFEYWNPNRKAADRFLSADEQRALITFAIEAFRQLFSQPAKSACAPGYRSNATTARCWAEQGIRIVQNGPGKMRAPHFDELGLLQTYRSLDFEPALNPELRWEDAVASARQYFRVGLPFILSVHSINFHSTLAQFRQRTIPLLMRLLRGLRQTFPDILFVTSQQLLEIVQTGTLATSDGLIRITVQKIGGRN